MAELPQLALDEARLGVPRRPVARLQEQLRPLLLGLPVLTALTGVLYPLTLAVMARTLFSHQAEGSLLRHDDTTVGSDLIGQGFAGPGYFHPRPSAAGAGYDAMSSGGTNLGPTNPKLRATVQKHAADYRRSNGLPADTPIPVDAVTCSGSGLDPHISPANAALQVLRIARERGLPKEVVSRLVADHTAGRQLGFLGEPRVAVLPLNLALDRLGKESPRATR